MVRKRRVNRICGNNKKTKKSIKDSKKCQEKKDKSPQMHTKDWSTHRYTPDPGKWTLGKRARRRIGPKRTKLGIRQLMRMCVLKQLPPANEWEHMHTHVCYTGLSTGVMMMSKISTTAHNSSWMSRQRRSTWLWSSYHTVFALCGSILGQFLARAGAVTNRNRPCHYGVSWLVACHAMRGIRCQGASQSSKLHLESVEKRKENWFDLRT